MDTYTIYTYRNTSELRKIQKETEVYPFIFEETLNLLKRDTNICVDISALIYNLQVNKNSILPAYFNLREISCDTLVIVNEILAEIALDLFPFLFSDYEQYYDEQEENYKDDDGEFTLTKPYDRRIIYKYNSNADLDKIIKYANANNIPIATFSQVNQDMHDEFEQFNRNEKLALLDLTSVSYAIQDNKNLIYAFEQLITLFSNIKVIAHTPQIDVLFEYFPLFFEEQKPISELIPELTNMGETTLEKETINKVTALNEKEYDLFVKNFCYNLIGHANFKERLKYVLKNFILLNRAKEQKVLSIFLFGSSGIGKTEVARLLANGLQTDCYFAKINFQNYSSQDALNSLIGSPAGYVGCNHGELSDKIQKSKVAVLLCDEFEKTTRPVFSFFLELLEEGQFTDSMAREYDMDGYIIIFTSNISNENEYKNTIPPELQTRFDLVCEFENPSIDDKKNFLELLLEKAQIKYSEQFSMIKFTENDKRSLFEFDYSEVVSLRDIKRIFNNRLMDLFARKNVI